MSLRPLAVLAGLALALHAAAAAAAPQVMLETDPSTFVFRGFAAHARVAPGDGHLAFGGGMYALDFPSLLVDLNGKNRDAGWDVRLELGGALFADYYLRPRAEGLFVGAELAVQRYRYTNDAAGGSAHATNGVLLPRIGYQWRPFHERAGLYVMPWAGLGVQTKLAGGETVGTRRYDLFPLVPYAAVHVGWQFDL